MPILFPKKSRILVMYRVLMHLFAMICIVSTFSSGVLLILLLCVGFSAGWCVYKRHDSAFDKTIFSFAYDQKNEWIVQITEKTMMRTLLQQSTVFMNCFGVLHFESIQTKQRVVVIIWPDSFDAHDFRVLRRCITMTFL